MWLAGLRGPVAFALAFSTPSQSKELLVSATLIVCFITTVVLGGATGLILEYFTNPGDEDMETELLANFDQPIYDGSSGKLVGLVPQPNWLQHLDLCYLRPCFGTKEIVDHLHHERYYEIHFKSPTQELE